jgi:hypothetical protein
VSQALRNRDTSGTALNEVYGQFDTLAGGYALDPQREMLLAALNVVVRDSLFYPSRDGPPAPSRLNEDGTPIQFATALGTDRPGFRFVGDVGPLDGSGRDRQEAAQRAMGELAVIIGAEREFEDATGIVEAFAPSTARDLHRDPAGAFWLGADFSPGAFPRMRLYMNGSWGNAVQCWDRVTAFADHFGQAHSWASLRRQLPEALKPLGLALTLTPGRSPVGAVYLRAFGLRISDYAHLADVAAGPSAALAVTRFGAALLAEEAAFPAPSAVLSFGFGELVGSKPQVGLSVDLELCGHCLFRDDSEARFGILSTLDALKVDPEPYLTLADVLTPGRSRPGPPRVHSFVGVGTKGAAPSFTVYMKPDMRG